LLASVAAHAVYNLLLAQNVPLAVSASLVLGLWLWLLARLTPVSAPLGGRDSLLFDAPR
jgi:hypothetical protein